MRPLRRGGECDRAWPNNAVFRFHPSGGDKARNDVINVALIVRSSKGWFMRVRHVLLAALLFLGLGQIATAAPVAPAAAASVQQLASGPELVRWRRHWHRRHWHHRRWHHRHWHRRHGYRRHHIYGRHHGYRAYGYRGHRAYRVRRGGWVDPRGVY
jgi:hypothetical protein